MAPFAYRPAMAGGTDCRPVGGSSRLCPENGAKELKL